jgi:hypothetical protein
VVRIGWEANSGAGHPWRIGTAANVGPYKECFRRLARIHKAAGLRVEWANAKGTAFPYMQTYPGDDVVDLWGLHQYDNDTRGIRFARDVARLPAASAFAARRARGPSGWRWWPRSRARASTRWPTPWCATRASVGRRCARRGVRVAHRGAA